MCDLLVITYNCNTASLHKIDCDNTLYLFDPSDSTCIAKLGIRHADVVPHDDIDAMLFGQVERFAEHFGRLLLVDNSTRPRVEPARLFEFDRDVPDDWLLNGVRLEPHAAESGFIPERYSLDGLMLNCSAMERKDIEMLKAQDVGYVRFPYFSRVIHASPLRCHEARSKGLSRWRISVNILV